MRKGSLFRGRRMRRRSNEGQLTFRLAQVGHGMGRRTACFSQPAGEQALLFPWQIGSASQRDSTLRQRDWSLEKDGSRPVLMWRWSAVTPVMTDAAFFTSTACT